MNNDTFVSKK